MKFWGGFKKNYDLTVEELLQKKRRMFFIEIFYVAISLMLLFAAGFFLDKITSLVDLPMVGFTNYILFVVMLSIMIILILWNLGLHFISNFHFKILDNKIMDLLIYMKKVNGGK